MSWRFPPFANKPAGASLAELTEQVRATEIAFAKTLADRDVKTFTSMIAPDVIWLADKPLRGPAEVLTSWQKFFDAPTAAIFMGAGDRRSAGRRQAGVEHRPGDQCRGQTRRHLHVDLAP